MARLSEYKMIHINEEQHQLLKDMAEQLSEERQHYVSMTALLAEILKQYAETTAKPALVKRGKL